MTAPPTRFLALPLPSSRRQALAPWLAELAALDPAVRPVRQDGLHLTLRFLGRLKGGLERSVSVEVAKFAQQVPGFELSVRGIGVFPSRADPKVVWAGVETGQAELERLVAGLAVALRGIALPDQVAPFRPHCTLARIGITWTPGATAALARIRARASTELALRWRARTIDLMESVPVPGEPSHYRVRTSWPLQDL
ncbi:MAG TPA: RNA 2',3'-cyclic phosphodiesterase [Candidatus Dormibacteraeota bacterium]|nr:RNA 2',3'-cyclic phosphodiesterase [Candidatus Dormibacteraeota bacterium]